MIGYSSALVAPKCESVPYCRLALPVRRAPRGNLPIDPVKRTDNAQLRTRRRTPTIGGAPMSRLAGKVAIITGGASGIGRGAVELFLREGAKVVAADIQDDKGALLVDELGPSVSYFRADVGEEREVEALVADTAKRHGRLDCLFNNAGLAGVSGPITETPFGEAEVTFQVLFWSVVFGMKYAGRVMRDQKSG